jgi:transposase
VLCELARTDGHRFRVLEPDSDETKALGALTRTREDLVRTGVAVADRLRAELERFWPGPIGLFTDLDGQISLAFLERYPSPADARLLGEKRMRAFLKRRGDAGARKPARLVHTQLVLCLVQTLRTLPAQIKTLEKQIAAAVRAHPDGEIFSSLFKGSTITAAALLAEIGDCRARYPNRDALAGDAGQAAVAIESGKRKTACFRRGCNKRLRASFSRLADTTRHWHPSAQDLYATARARGHDHPRALATAPHGHDPDLVGAPPRPRCHPADARRRHHRYGGPQGRARSA